MKVRTGNNKNPFPPVKSWHDFIQCFPQREKTSKGQPCYNQEKAFSFRLWQILWNTAQVKQKIRVVLPEAMHNKKLSLCNIIIFPLASLLPCLVIHALHCIEITWFSLAYCERPQSGWYIYSPFSWTPQAVRQHKTQWLIYKDVTYTTMNRIFSVPRAHMFTLKGGKE